MRACPRFSRDAKTADAFSLLLSLSRTKKEDTKLKFKSFKEIINV